jgi:hypothetical protein
MSAPQTLETLAQLLGTGTPAMHVRFLEAVGDLRTRPRHLRCSYAVKTLLWRWPDLKPHVRAGLAADLAERWQAYAAEAEDAALAVQKPSAPAGQLESVPKPAGQTCRAPATPPPVIAPRREDAFDRFLGWLAGLLGR